MTLLALLIIYMLLQLESLLLPLLQTVKMLVWPVAIAALFTYLLHPLVEGLYHRGMKRSIAVFIIFFKYYRYFCGYGNDRNSDHYQTSPAGNGSTP